MQTVQATIYREVSINLSKDAYKTKTTEADQHFRFPGRNFNRHAKFILIQQLNSTELDKRVTNI